MIPDRSDWKFAVICGIVFLGGGQLYNREYKKWLVVLFGYIVLGFITPTVGIAYVIVYIAAIIEAATVSNNKRNPHISAFGDYGNDIR